MKNRLTIENTLTISALESELELERAIRLHSKLNWMLKDDPSLEEKRQHLGKLIQDFEEKYWGDEETISPEQIIESDLAEMMVEKESLFFSRRKEHIRDALKKFNMNQQDLGEILRQKKNYMSELINGVRPFSLPDLQIIHQFLKIDLKLLIPPFADLERAERTVERIQKTMSEKTPKQIKNKFSKEMFLFGEAG